MDLEGSVDRLEEIGSGMAYFEPRVMAHQTRGRTEYAIHDVYFDRSGRVVNYTSDALSPRCGTVAELRAALLELLSADGSHVVSGDLQYDYPREEIEEWLVACDAPIIEFEP